MTLVYAAIALAAAIVALRLLVGWLEPHMAFFPIRGVQLTPEALSALVRGLGIESRNVKAAGITRRGMSRADLDAAITAREAGTGEAG